MKLIDKQIIKAERFVAKKCAALAREEFLNWKIKERQCVGKDITARDAGKIAASAIYHCICSTFNLKPDKRIRVNESIDNIQKGEIKMDEKKEREEFEKIWDKENPPLEDEKFKVLKEIAFKWWLERAKGERKLRKLLWLRHGCPLSGLYGDDGEMQCNNFHSHKPIDFVRDSAQEIEDKLRPDQAMIREMIEKHLEEKSK